MKKLLFLTLIAFLATVNMVFAQGFQPPSEGKAVVYFTRVTSYGKPTEFEFFHQDKYIGAFKGDQYMRYECDPGNQLFWASSENKEFLTAELEAGKIYIVMVDVIIGVMKAHVGLNPVTAEESENINKAKLLVNKKAAIVIPEAKIEKMNKKLEKFISKQLEAYDNTKNEKNFKHLSIEMAIPIDTLN